MVKLHGVGTYNPIETEKGEKWIFLHRILEDSQELKLQGVAAEVVRRVMARNE